MNKKLLCLALCVLCLLTLAACGCKHETWNEADCVNPKTCAECGETEGEALGHTWVDADCVAPKTCSDCGETEGEALGHTWVEADCVTAKTCSVCGETEGEALGHTWMNADCVTAKTCSDCAETEGEALGHSFGAWVEIDENNETHTCDVCGYAEQQTIDRKAKAMELLEGEWELVGFNIEDSTYLLEQIENPDQWMCTLHFGSDGSVKRTYRTGDVAYYNLDFDSFFQYEVSDTIAQYGFLMDDANYYYATGLFILEDGSVQLWAELDQDYWIFLKK